MTKPLAACGLALLFSLVFHTDGRADFPHILRSAQSKVVKIYGAGGMRQLEAYQTGILISADGQVLTALSYVLDTDDLVVMLDDGRKWQAELVGSDPVSEVAVLRLPLEGEELPYFDLHQAVSAEVGQRVLALSNLYGIATGNEPVSVLQGVVTAIAPLDARRGAYQANFRDQVYVLDAYSNNPGAAGGALVDWDGQLVGILGKELRSRVTGTWLNYALPADKIAPIVADILAGKQRSAADDDRLPPEQALTTAALGFMLVPNVVARTPPYIDAVRPESPAAKAGLKTDDLVVFVADQPTSSYQSVIETLAQHELSEEIAISVLRDGELVEFKLQGEAAAAPPEEPAEP